MLNIGPHFPTDAITETSCGLKDNFVCTKLSARLIIMPITAQKPELGGIQTSIYRDNSALYALKQSVTILLFALNGGCHIIAETMAVPEGED